MNSNLAFTEHFMHPETNKNLNLDKKNYKPNILIVEDDVTSEPLWDHIIRLAHAKAEFDWAVNLNEASELIKNSFIQGRPYDLIISDIFLSGAKTGIDLWHYYHEAMHGKIILVSAIDHKKLNSYFKNTLSRPIYLKKPLNLSESIEIVYDALRT